MTLIFILFVLFIALLLLPSQIGEQASALQDVKVSLNVRMEQLKKDFQFRTKELSRRLKSADLAQDEWQKLNDELQAETRTSINATRLASQTEQIGVSWPISAALIIAVSIISFTTYQISGSLEQVKQQIDITNLIKEDTLAIEKLAKKVRSEKSQQALYDLYLALRTQVDLLPSDIESWRHLASFNADYGRISEARAAMKVAMKLEPDNTLLKIDLAQILLASKKQPDLFYSRQLIQEVLKVQPDNQDALFLLGQNSFQFGMFKRAVRKWEQLLEIARPDSAMATMLKKRIKTTRELMTASENKTVANNDSEKVIPAGATLTVDLVIPEQIQSLLTGKETVFIFVRAVDGPAFPLAAIKTTVGEVNKQIVLTDNNAMQKEHPLSRYDKVQVVARISMAGTPTASAGDIQGQSSIINKPFPESALTVVIDEYVK